MRASCSFRRSHRERNLTGTPDPDRIFGTARCDVIKGLAEDDVLFGKNNPRKMRKDNRRVKSPDVLIAAEGNDSLLGGPGRDSLDGGPGNDGLYDDDGTAGDVLADVGEGVVKS